MKKILGISLFTLIFACSKENKLNEAIVPTYSPEYVEFFTQVYVVEMESRKLKGKVKRIESLYHNSKRIINEYDLNGKRTENMMILQHGDTVLQDLKNYNDLPNPEFYPCGLIRKTTETEYSTNYFKLYNYNLNDSTITITEYNTHDTFVAKEVRKFNKLGQDVEHWSDYPNGEKHYSYFKYNEHGDIYEFNDTHVNGDSILNTNKYHLEYDSIGNIIEEIALSNMHTITRVITYY